MSDHPPLQKAKDLGDMILAVERTREEVAAVWAAQRPEQIPHWVILGPGTIDHPGSFVARLWVLRPVYQPTGHLVRADTLDQLLDLLPRHLTNLPFETEDPNILACLF